MSINEWECYSFIYGFLVSNPVKVTGAHIGIVRVRGDYSS